MQFYVILPDIPSFIQPALNVIRNDWRSSSSKNHNSLSKLNSGTFRIIDTLRLMSLL